MSHSDNTQQKFNTNFPEWLDRKLWVKHNDPEDPKPSASRPSSKRQWKRDIEMELSALKHLR
jgi:hypothetical protein